MASSTRKDGVPQASADLAQAVGVRAVAGPDHQHHVDLVGERAHGGLAVLGGVADVAGVGADDGRKAPPQRRDDVAGVVDGQRGLRDVGELAAGRPAPPPRRPSSERDEMHRAGHLAERADHLRMAVMADQHDLETLLGVATALHMHLAHQRAGGVDHLQATAGGALLDPSRHAVRGEHRHRALRHLVDLRRRSGRPSPEGSRPRACCGRSRAGRRRARRSAPAPAPRSRWPARRRRRSRAAWRAGLSEIVSGSVVNGIQALDRSFSEVRAHHARRLPAVAISAGRAGAPWHRVALSARNGVAREAHQRLTTGARWSRRTGFASAGRRGAVDRSALGRRTLKNAGNRGPYGSGRSSRRELDRASAAPGLAGPTSRGSRSLGRSRSTALFTRIGEAVLGACAAMARRRPWIGDGRRARADRRRRLRLDGAHRQHLDGGHPLGLPAVPAERPAATAAFFRARSW